MKCPIKCCTLSSTKTGTATTISLLDTIPISMIIHWVNTLRSQIRQWLNWIKLNSQWLRLIQCIQQDLSLHLKIGNTKLFIKCYILSSTKIEMDIMISPPLITQISTIIHLESMLRLETRQWLNHFLKSTQFTQQGSSLHQKIGNMKFLIKCFILLSMRIEMAIMILQPLTIQTNMIIPLENMLRLKILSPRLSNNFRK